VSNISLATLLVEGEMSWPSKHFIGGDNSSAQIQSALTNTVHAHTHADLFLWDCTALPLRDESVDAITSDIPFGKRHSTQLDVRKLYPIMLQEMARVLRTGKKAVLLTSQKSLMARILREQNRVWKVKNRIYINNGGIDCFLFVLIKKVLDVTKK